MSRHNVMPAEWANVNASDRARRAWQARHANDSDTKARVFKHPACADDMEYSGAQLEFMQAVEAYKRDRGIRFPTVCEYLYILVGLGYQKVGLSA